MYNMFGKSSRVGRASGEEIASDISKLAIAKGKVRSKCTPAKDVIILRSMYMPGFPILYRVAYPLKKENVWEIADIIESELTPAIKPLAVDTGDF